MVYNTCNSCVLYCYQLGEKYQQNLYVFNIDAFFLFPMPLLIFEITFYLIVYALVNIDGIVTVIINILTFNFLTSTFLWFDLALTSSASYSLE